MKSIRKLALAVSLATAAVSGTDLVLSNPASALCVTPLETGTWWNQTANGPAKVDIEMIDCGDQILNGVRTLSRYRVNVWVRQSDGNLFHRGTFFGHGEMSEGAEWVYVEVPTGGYVDNMWMRVYDPTRPSQRMRVWIDHHSLDSKPSAVSNSWFLRTPPPAPEIAVSIRPGVVPGIFGF